MWAKTGFSRDSTGSAGSWTIKVKKTWVDEKGDTYCQFL